MGRTAKLTISLPEDLITFADNIAKKNKISRSKAITLCLEEIAEKHRIADMTEGYKAMAEEQRELANLTNDIAHEVIPEWE